MFFSKLSAFLSLVASLSVMTTTKAQVDASYAQYRCSNTTFNPNSTYQSNLNELVSWLSSEGNYEIGYSNTTAGASTPGNSVYGAFLCRGDINASTCRECVSAAARDVQQRCWLDKESVVWYAQFMVRYSDVNFFTLVDETPNVLMNAVNISEPDKENPFTELLLVQAMNVLAQEAAHGYGGTGKKFAANESKLTGSVTLYALVQCTLDLSVEDCNKCVLVSTRHLPSYSKGGRVLTPSCNLRYETYPFYKITLAESPPKPEAGGRIKSSTIILVVVPAAVVLAILLCLGWSFRRKSRILAILICSGWSNPRKSRQGHTDAFRENFGKEITTWESLQFDFATIEAATDNFSQENRIGKGGFGEVYKGVLGSNGQKIAVKRLAKNSAQGAAEFKNEVLLIARLQHRNLVTLLGFCLEEQEKILVYEYVPNQSLDYFLFEHQNKWILTWSNRYKIIEGIIQGILYLHEHSRLKIIHRDLKPSNILLDGHMNPKISDFGLARMIDINHIQGSTHRIVGTYGYMSPEYAMHGEFSTKSDVFSFGVVVLEIVSGKRNICCFKSHRVDNLLSNAWKEWKDQTPLHLLDPILRESYSEVEVINCIQIGLLCVQENPEDRPSMATISSYFSTPSIELPSPQEPIFSMQSRGKPKETAHEMGSSLNQMSASEFVPR